MTSAPIPFSVITGFLGSGKTTLLAHLLRDPALARTAVIVNEFGAVGLDHLLVEASQEQVVSLDSGCICCTVRGDLVRTACDLLARRAAGTVVAFERIVIETTGLADPAPILQALMTDPSLADALCLESVITTVDAAAGAATLDAHPESVKQAAIADRIVVTKTDLADPAAGGLIERLRELNPGAVRLTAVHGALDANRLFWGGLYDPAVRGPNVRRWLAAEAVQQGLTDTASHSRPHDGGGDHGHVSQDHADRDHADHHHSGHGQAHDHADRGLKHGLADRGLKHGLAGHDHVASRHDDAIASFCVRRTAPLHAATLSLFLQVLAEHCGAGLLRLKGLIDVRESPGRPAVIHGVQHVFHPPAWLDAWPDNDRTTRIVFITRGLQQAWVEALLDALDDEVAARQAAYGR